MITDAHSPLPEYLVLRYGISNVAVRRPPTYEEALKAAKGCLIKMGENPAAVEAANVVLTTTELPGCRGLSVRIYDDLWDDISAINRLTIEVVQLSNTLEAQLNATTNVSPAIHSGGPSRTQPILTTPGASEQDDQEQTDRPDALEAETAPRSSPKGKGPAYTVNTFRAIPEVALRFREVSAASIVSKNSRQKRARSDLVGLENLGTSVFAEGSDERTPSKRHRTQSLQDQSMDVDLGDQTVISSAPSSTVRSLDPALVDAPSSPRYEAISIELEPEVADVETEQADEESAPERSETPATASNVQESTAEDAVSEVFVTLDEVDHTKYQLKELLQDPVCSTQAESVRFKSVVDDFLMTWEGDEVHFGVQRGRDEAKILTTAFIETADEWTKSKLDQMEELSLSGTTLDAHAILFVFFVRRRLAFLARKAWRKRSTS